MTPAGCPAGCAHAFAGRCGHDDPAWPPSYRAPVPIRVVIADDNLLVREGLAQVLVGQQTVELVGAYADLPSLVEAIEADPPDVVLTDIRMPPSNSDEGIRLAALLRETNPDVGVVVLSQYSDPLYALALLESGSDGRGYLLKERVHDPAQLLSALETVADGGSVVDMRIVDVLVASKAHAEHSSVAALTPREREVLAQIAQGKSNSAIAETLVLIEASRGKAHQPHLLQAGSLRGGGRQQAGQGHPGVPVGGPGSELNRSLSAGRAEMWRVGPSRRLPAAASRNTRAPSSSWSAARR